jgi:hypothetical protein
MDLTKSSMRWRMKILYVSSIATNADPNEK